MSNKFLEGIFAPLNTEHEIHTCEVVGEIPMALNGILFKIGSNPQYVYSDNYHLFEGDGMIHALILNSGKASCYNKWVRTEKFNKERKEQKAVFAGFRDKEKMSQLMSGMVTDTVNTNVIWHGGKLLALNEATMPYEINPDNLATIGKFDFANKLNSSMTAHPRICAKTGELILFNYLSREINSKHIDYYVADKDNNITHNVKLEVPYKSLMHDFAITEDYTIFALFPLTSNIRRLLDGGELYNWEPNLGCYFGIMPRYGTSDDCVWIHQEEPGLAIHIVSAYQENGLLIFDACYTDNIPDTANGFKVDSEEVFPSYLTRWTFDLTTKTIISKVKLDNVACEFPKIDERYTGLKYNHIYMAETKHSNWYGHDYDAISHYNALTKVKQVHEFGVDSTPLEPIFVPQNKTSVEGDGFLLVYVYRKLENRSDLVILDAQNIAKTPLAIIKLPYRVPFTFHGTFVSTAFSRLK